MLNVKKIKKYYLLNSILVYIKLTYFYTFLQKKHSFKIKPFLYDKYLDVMILDFER